MRGRWPRSEHPAKNAPEDNDATRPSAVFEDNKRSQSSSRGARQQVGAQSVSSAASQRSRRSGISPSVPKATLKKAQKVGSVKVDSADPNSILAAEETVALTETPPSTLIKVAPRVMSGVVFERTSSSTFYEDKVLIVQPENDDAPDTGYIRFVQPLTKDLAKSLPLVDSPNQTSAHEEGVEVSQKFKVVAWSEDAVLEVSLPTTSDNYTLVVEIGIVHNDKMCPLGIATLQGKSAVDRSEKTQMVVRPQPPTTATTKNNAFFNFIGHQRENKCSNYRLGPDSALALEMEIIEGSAKLQATEDLAKQERASTPRGLLSNFAARFGTHGATSKPREERATMHVNDKTQVSITAPATGDKSSSSGIADENSNVCSARSTVNMKNTDSPAHQGNNTFFGDWELAGERIDPNTHEECEQRLPFDEMTEFSDGEQTRESYPVALESQNCYMFAGDLADQVLPSSSSSSSSESTNQESSCEGSTVNGDSLSSPASIARSLEDIMQKRERGRKTLPHPLDTLKLKRDKKLQLESTDKSKKDSTASTTSSSPRSSDTSRTTRLKKAIKARLKKVILDFNNRGIKKAHSREEIEGVGSVEGQENSILDQDSMTALTSKDAKWTAQASMSQDFVNQLASCCSPFPSNNTIIDDHAISLSPRKVAKLAVALKVSPSKLVRALELVEE